MPKQTEIIIEDLSDRGKIPLKDVESAVIQVEKKWFLKTSDKIVRIGSSYYLRDSDNIITSYKGEAITKSNSVTLYDGAFASLSDKSLVKLPDSSHGILDYNAGRKKNGGAFKYTDKDAVKFKGSIFHKSDCVESSPFYKEFRHIPDTMHRKCEVSSQNFLANDTIELAEFGTLKSVFVSKLFLPKADIKTIIRSISTSGNSVSFNTVNFYNCKEAVWSDVVDCFVLPDEQDKIEKDLKSFYRRNSFSKSTDLLKTRISERYASLDKIPQLGQETSSKEIRIVEGNIQGGIEYYRATPINQRKMFSPSLQLTGTIGYTFGIEHETCAGILPSYVCESFGLNKVGDGSTRFSHLPTLIHYEYVTSVLHGDLGVRKFKRYLPIIGKHTLANEKCSTHIHVGGQSYRNLETDTPVFNREMSSYAIQLGCQVEDSLAKLMPEYRHPAVNRHCRSIKEYSKFGFKKREDQKRLIASYVFGSSSLSRRYNKKTSLPKWNNEHRKTWLNLVNCNSTNGQHRQSSFSTIEFRIFPMTYDPDRLHFYTLISLAFVWFVENRKKLIEKGNVTIQDVLKEAYEDKYIYKFVESMLNK